MGIEIHGFRFSTTCAGIKRQDRPDMALIVSDPPARWAGFFTKNLVKAAPVIYGMQRFREGSPVSAVLVNSGNANACNGTEGMEDLLLLCHECAGHLKVPEDQVLMASTGVIGERLPVDRMRKALTHLVRGIGKATLKDVAEAIMTTDRYPKWEMSYPEGFPDVKIGGVVKGAGMICPNMATMLGFFVMNAGLAMDSLRDMSRKAVEESFNRIMIDGDQSTNDMVLVLDNGVPLSGTKESGRLNQAVSYELNKMMHLLAEKIVDNGEGVTKVVTLIVEGAATREDAKRVAESIGKSPLVKTAFYGEDPNWGRVVAAIGYSGANIDLNNLDIRFNDTLLVSGGKFMGEAAERQVAEVMKERGYTLRVSLGHGEADYHLITSDLSVEYVKINADYRS